MNVLSPKDKNQFLFHYTSLPTALEHILPNALLRMGKFINTTDPRENKEWNFQVTTSGVRGSSDFEIENRIWAATRGVQEALRVLCLTEDLAEEEGETPVELRGFGLSRMWDRYAQRHKGVCLAFDRNALSIAVSTAIFEGVDPLTRLVKTDHVLWSQPVDYDVLARRRQNVWELNGDGVTANGEINEIRHHVTTHYEGLLFLKSKDWEGEHEYRWVYMGDPNAPAKNIPINGALRAVFLGVDVSESYYPSFKEACPAGVSIYQMRWDWGFFREPWPI